MSVDAIGLDARDRLVEDEDYEPELLQSDEKRLLDDEVDQISLVYCLMKARSYLLEIGGIT